MNKPEVVVLSLLPEKAAAFLDEQRMRFEQLPVRRNDGAVVMVSRQDVYAGMVAPAKPPDGGV